jgi:hypothetical protein
VHPARGGQAHLSLRPAAGGVAGFSAPVFYNPDGCERETARMGENPHRFTVTLTPYDVVVNSVHYREDGHRDNWMIGDLYLKHQAPPTPPRKRKEAEVPRGHALSSGFPKSSVLVKERTSVECPDVRSVRQAAVRRWPGCMIRGLGPIGQRLP